MIAAKMGLLYHNETIFGLHKDNGKENGNY